MLIAGVGLFGLTLFVVKTQTKEIGIKKVFGSSENSIVVSYLLRNFMIALISGALSIPLTLYFMINWLKNYSYKVPINWWIFALSFIVSAIVVLMTVSIHSYKAARINPVKALKYE
jgi:putative ABC transport system permease protein